MNRDFVIHSHCLPERFTIVGALHKRKNDYVVIGTEESPTIPKDRNFCSWLYSPECGFAFGHYGLTEKEALKDLIERG